MKNEYFVSCSFGADSTATAILAIEKGEPISALVYCEIMFDKERSAEVPEHRDFIYNTAIPYFEQRGVKTIVLRAEKTAREWMEARVAGRVGTGAQQNERALTFEKFGAGDTNLALMYLVLTKRCKPSGCLLNR